MVTTENRSQRDLMTRYGCGVIFLIALAIVCLRSTESLWLDETITAWVIRGSLGETVSRSIEFQGQSPLYFLIVWCSSCLFGHSELALRAPGIGAGAVSIWLFYRLNRLLIKKELALIAAALLALHPVFLTNVTNARPYSLAIALFLCSLYFFCRYFQLGKERNLIWGIIASVALFYTHYVLVLGLLVLPGLAILLNPKDLDYRKVFLYGAIAALFCLPGFWHLKLIASKAGIYEIAGSSEWVSLVTSSPFFLPLVLLLALIFLLRVLNRENVQLPESPANIVFALHWPILALILVLGLHHFLGITLLLERYRLWMIPGEALVCAMAIGTMVARRHRVLSLFIVLLLSLVPMWTRAPKEDWRSAISWVETNYPSQYPIFIYSGLIETQDVSWLRDPRKEEYLKSPWIYYGKRPATDVELLPLDFRNEEQAHYLNKTVRPKIESTGKAVVVTRKIFLGHTLSSDQIERNLPDYSAEQKPFGQISVIKLSRNPLIFSELKPRGEK